jgi:hypothetical protein
MKLPVIKHLTQFIEENDEDYIIDNRSFRSND